MALTTSLSDPRPYLAACIFIYILLGFLANFRFFPYRKHKLAHSLCLSAAALTAIIALFLIYKIVNQ